MLKVRNAEEALLLAKEMCSRHGDLVRTVGPANTPRDVAMKILLEELQLGEPIAKKMQTLQRIGPDATINDRGSSAAPPTTGGGNVKLRSCPYCTEPTSRFCKETGRRHQTAEEKALLMWKRVYRQFSLASQFISSARLSKKNTCVEDYAVELDF